MSDSPLFLGLDLSTQGLKAVLITEDSQVTHESAVNFDKELPRYGINHGLTNWTAGMCSMRHILERIPI